VTPQRLLHLAPTCKACGDVGEDKLRSSLNPVEVRAAKRSSEVRFGIDRRTI
jgi:hypothetical protein